jgi:hypothetical protein
MNTNVKTIAAPTVRVGIPELLVRHLTSVAPPPRPPARLRLEEALGQELAQRLVASLVQSPLRR